MKFKFRLQKVLEARKVLQDLAHKEFQDAMNLLTIEETALQDLENKKSTSYQRLGQLQDRGGLSVSRELQDIHSFQQGLIIRREKQVLKIRQAQDLVEKKREILQQVTIEYRMVERLKEKKLQEFMQDAAKEAQKESDEMSILRFGHKDVK